MTPEKLKTVVEGAFQPLRCVAKIEDYDHKLSLRISDSSGTTVLTTSPVPLHNISSVNQLRDFVDEVRSQIREKGLVLDDWDLT